MGVALAAAVDDLLGAAVHSVPGGAELAAAHGGQVEMLRIFGAGQKLRIRPGIEFMQMLIPAVGAGAAHRVLQLPGKIRRGGIQLIAKGGGEILHQLRRQQTPDVRRAQGDLTAGNVSHKGTVAHADVVVLLVLGNGLGRIRHLHIEGMVILGQ